MRCLHASDLHLHLGRVRADALVARPQRELGALLLLVPRVTDPPSSSLLITEGGKT